MDAGTTVCRVPTTVKYGSNLGFLNQEPRQNHPHQGRRVCAFRACAPQINSTESSSNGCANLTYP